MDIASLTAANTPNPATSGAFSRLTSDFDTFLTLLTTQLQNQDPLEPLDTEQFTQQLVQFAGVEQSIQTNANLETLIALQATTDRQASIDLVGRVASVSGSEVQIGANNNQPVAWRYSLAENAASLSLDVVDASGRSVATLPGPATTGRHDLVWDGRLANGSRAPAGTYQLQITATGENGTALTSVIESRGTVQSVIFSGTTPQLIVNGRQVSLDSVTRVDAQF